MNSAPEAENSIDYQLYLGIIRQKKFLSVLIFLAVIAVVILIALFSPRTYEAKSLVLIERSKVLAPLLQGMAVDSRSDALMNSIRDNLLSRNIVEKAIKKIDLDAKLKNPSQQESQIASIQKEVNIRIPTPTGRGGQADLFELSYQGKDPQLVRDLVNALVSTYIEANMGSARGETVKAISFIEEQLLFYKEKLDSADRALREFQEKNPGVVGINQAAMLDRIRQLKTRISEEQITLTAYQKERESIQAQLKGEKPLSVTTLTRESTPERRLSDAKARLELLSARYTPLHPEVVALKNEIAEMEAATKKNETATAEGGTSKDEVGVNPIYQQLRERLSQAQTNYELQQAKIGELRRQLALDEGTLNSVPREQEEYAQLMRGRAVYQNMYDTLMARLESARVSKGMEESDSGDSFRVVDPAILPTQPVKPDRVKILLLGMFAAIGAALAGPIGLEMLRPTFRDVKTLESMLGVKVVGMIPVMDVGLGRAVLQQKWKMYLWMTAGGGLLYMMVLARELMYKMTGKYFPF